MNVFIMMHLAYLSHENVRLHKQDGSEAICKEMPRDSEFFQIPLRGAESTEETRSYLKTAQYMLKLKFLRSYLCTKHEESCDYIFLSCLIHCRQFSFQVCIFKICLQKVFHVSRLTYFSLCV